AIAGPATKEPAAHGLGVPGLAAAPELQLVNTTLEVPHRAFEIALSDLNGRNLAVLFGEFEGNLLVLVSEYPQQIIVFLGDLFIKGVHVPVDVALLDIGGNAGLEVEI